MDTDTTTKDIVGKTQVPVDSKEFGLDIVKMAEAGLHFGQRTSRTHPKMMPYIFGIRNTIHLIDLEKTLEKLTEALQFVKTMVREKKTVLLVGTKPQMKDLVVEIATECHLPYVVDRWLGGTFTNFQVLTRRIEHFKDLENKKASGELAKYTKKERLKIDQELKNLEDKFGGIKNMANLPDAVFICDMRKDKGAINEAEAKKIPIIAICDTNTDPDLADFPIPANDDAVSSVRYILDKVKEVILKTELKTEKQDNS